MENLMNYIKKDYTFLLKRGYKIEETQEKDTRYSIINLKGESGLILCFTLENGLISLAFTSQYVLKNHNIGKYDKYYEMFFIAKLLNPEINYSEIIQDTYQLLIKNKITNIEKLFNSENIEKTIKQIKTISVDYNKIRWKM